MSKDRDGELDALRARNAILEAEVARLSKPPIRRFRQPVGDGVFQMPEADELKKLRQIVLAAYPQLAPPTNEDPAKSQETFSNCFLALGLMPRNPDGILAMSFDKLHSMHSDAVNTVWISQLRQRSASLRASCTS
jgi:hypothetical protein